MSGDGGAGAARARVAPYWPVLRQSVVYEMRKQLTFRMGFFVREISNGLVEPIVMVFLYWALYQSAGGDATLGGWTFPEIVRYFAGLIVVRKILIQFRALDLSTQIFEGRITKYLVMPFEYFVLAQARFVQYTLLQIVVALIAWSIGALLFTEHWLFPTSAMAAFQAFVLVLLGSYCCFLLYFILNALAFWLDIVWTLLVMSWFVISFVGGVVIPVSQMPAPLFEVFRWLFPYWAISAPVEVLMGRLGTADFVRGVLVLSASLLVLETLRRTLWRRGLAHYAGAGM